MIPRILAQKIKEASTKLPVVALMGPRQSGKTTLIKSLFPHKPYVSLEELDIRDYARNDPHGFLNDYPQGAVIDEIQRVPELCAYIQTRVDEVQKQGFFILTGSQQLLLMESLSQSLAGRVQTLSLLPFSLEELSSAGKAPKTIDAMIFKGFYPRLFDKKIAPLDWYPDYLRTYVERDVRLIKNIEDLATFQKFLKLCAARTGQLLSLTSLAEECGIRHNTARSWIGILEASFIIYLLRPHHRNFNKRIVKTPKLYFYDTGIVCSLLEIENEKQLHSHPLRGSLFETAILGELIKCRLNRGLPLNFYFWRDKTGHEIDCVIDRAGHLIPIEIKSAETFTDSLARTLHYWGKISSPAAAGPEFLVYGGNLEQQRKKMHILGWKTLAPLLKSLL